MNDETETALEKSLRSIDRLRRRIYALGWLVVGGTILAYGRLAYLQRTSDDLEALLSASVAALTFLVAWVGFAVILMVVRSAQRILRAFETLTRGPGRT